MLRRLTFLLFLIQEGHLDCELGFTQVWSTWGRGPPYLFEALVLTVKTQQEEGKYVLEMHPELSTARPAIKGN